MLRLKYFLIILISFLISCINHKNKIVGVYTVKNQLNTIDTLRILSNNQYCRDLYRKNDNTLIYHNTGKWSYGNQNIILTNFLPDEDDKYSKEGLKFVDVLITSSFEVGTKDDKLIIYHRKTNEECYYTKE